MEPEVKSVPEVKSESESMCIGLPVRERPNAFVRAMIWTFVGEGGLRAGWSVLLFLLFTVGLGSVATFAVKMMHLAKGASQAFTSGNMMTSELIILLIITLAATLVALIERRHLLDYYFRGPSRVRHFLTGLVGGFASLSLLMAGLYAGGWIHFGGVALTGTTIWTNAAMWGVAFLAVGFVEEGSFRCFFLYTLTRGLNFWWAVGIQALICADLVITGKGNGIWGVYIISALGLLPCLMLELRKSESSGFWQAAWVTSTLFGFVHTGNGGESWIGIFGAAAIGFIFCVSVRLTGSVWWAIGFHAAWDWTETYFYGTADSGNVATGHFLTTNPVGNVLWSGGETGPEGSLLLIPVMVVILAGVVLAYRKKSEATAGVAELTAS